MARDTHAVACQRRASHPAVTKLGAFHCDRHRNHGHRRAGEQHYNAADAEPGRGTGQCDGGDVGRNVSGIPSIDGNRYVGFDIVGLFGMADFPTSSGRRNGWPRLALAVPSLA